MKKTYAFVILALFVFMVFGCKSSKEEPSAQQVSTTGPAAATAASAEDTGVESDISGLDTLSTELDTSELDALDKELQDITW